MEGENSTTANCHSGASCSKLKLGSAIQRRNCYRKDKYYENQLRYPLDGDLSNGTTGARSTIILLSVLKMLN